MKLLLVEDEALLSAAMAKGLRKRGLWRTARASGRC